MQPFEPSMPVDSTFRDAVTSAVKAFLDTQSSIFGDLGEPVENIFALAGIFTGGGKRLRPAFCYWSYVAAGGDPDSAAIIQAAASLDLLHVSALVHDDVVDASDLRRGLPAAHIQYQTRHSLAGGAGSSEAFGRAGAILLGDLLLGLSAEMFDDAGFAPDFGLHAREHLHAMRTEVILGQLLDVSLQSMPPADATKQLAAAAQVTEYKTARYSVCRPCQIGGSLARNDGAFDRTFASFGSPLGRAFQLRDDVLGIFGDQEVTGKPAGGDLREGKRTTLVTLALSNACQAGSEYLAKMLGNPDLTDTQVVDARGIIEDSGARKLVEQQIAALHEQAVTVLSHEELAYDGRTALIRLAELSVKRDS